MAVVPIDAQKKVILNYPSLEYAKAVMELYHYKLPLKKTAPGASSEWFFGQIHNTINHRIAGYQVRLRGYGLNERQSRQIPCALTPSSADCATLAILNKCTSGVGDTHC